MDYGKHSKSHSFRVTTITDLLEQGVPLEDVQRLAGHADPPHYPPLVVCRDETIQADVIWRLFVSNPTTLRVDYVRQSDVHLTMYGNQTYTSI